MGRIEERLEIMGVQTSDMTAAEKFTAATGLTRYDATMAANDWYVPAGAANTPSQQVQETEETPEVYTAETAAAYNATLPGAKTTSDWKVEPVEAVEGVEAQEAVLYEDADEYNTAKGTELTDEQFEALDEAEKIKTPAVEGVEAVEAVEGVHYTQEEADAYNATLDGAVKAGDPVVSTATVEG
jgi:hypothetical protein